jgi:hypothetical protein
MKRFIISLAAILLFASASSARSKDSGGVCQGLSDRVLALVSQYKELRNESRRLPPGKYDEDLKSDRGKLHRVLSSLGVELGRPPYTRRTILSCLGAPDAIKTGRQMSNYLVIYNRELKKAGRKVEKKANREYLIYFWRGWHDFIFFISEGGRIVDHGWWFAYE